MSTIAHDHARPAHARTTTTRIIPSGITRWLTTTNHKDIGTMYLWFSFTMFLVGGTMALVIRAELFQPGLQIVRSGVLQLDDHAARPHHGVRRDHAGGRRLRELADPDDDRRARHGVRADEQLELLAAAARGDPARRLVLRARRRRGGAAGRSIRRSSVQAGMGMDLTIFAIHILGASSIMGSINIITTILNLRAPGMTLMKMPLFVLDVAHHRLPADRGDAGARGRGDDAADRPPLRHDVLQRGGRRRPGAVPARVLVLRAPRGLHHDPAGVRHRLADHPGVLAQAAVRLRVDGVRDGRHRDPVVHRLGAPHVHRRACRPRASCSSCTRRC